MSCKAAAGVSVFLTCCMRSRELASFSLWGTDFRVSVFRD